MPRLVRAFQAGVPLHIIQRGNNRSRCFCRPADYRCYQNFLHEACHELGARVHAYVLMTNHSHLLLTPRSAGDVSAIMQIVAQRYTQFVNWRYRRTGSLWDGRYKAALVHTETYLLVCQRYIELNPVRAGMVEYPGQYPWSSFRRNGEGRPDSLVAPHELYMALGADDTARQRAYRQLFEQALDEKILSGFGLPLTTTLLSATNSFCVLCRRAADDQTQPRTGNRGQTRRV